MVFVQFALSWQEWFPLHSSTSKELQTAKKIISQLCEIHRAWAITVLKTTVEIPLLNCDNAGSSHKKKPNYLLHVKSYHLLILCRVTASPISKKKYGLPSHQNKPPKATIKKQWNTVTILGNKNLLTVPVQLCPSPIYPGLHVQTYDPYVLLHAAFMWHLWGVVLHSSVSVTQ